MSFFNQFNNDIVIRDGVDLDALDFHKLEEYEGGIIYVDGFFFTKGKYGEQVVVVGNDAKINMPGYAVRKFKRIDENEEAKERVIRGELVITNIEPLTTSNGDTYAFKLEDKADLPKEEQQ